jgi:RNA polymerase sigma factor (sigma-70 family)
MGRITAGLPRHEIQCLFRDGVTTGLTDRELLERFATARDRAGELAFATLVARHGPMVWSVCRRALGNMADVDDAFQATFLVLVRRAVDVRVQDSLGPWLYGVAVRVARRARTSGLRRAVVELDATIAATLPAPRAGGDWDLRMVIDEAIARLPAGYRSAVVLCHLEGLTHEEAAERLRCPVGTVRSRLARGRALLRKRLERAGLGIHATAALPLSSLEPPCASSSIAPQLIDATIRGATLLACGGPVGGSIPARILQLTVGVSRTMTISKASIAVSLFGLVGLAAWGAAVYAGQVSGAAAQPRFTVTQGGPPPSLARTPTTAQRPNPTTDSRPDLETTNPKAEPVIPDDLPPVVISVDPPLGAVDVDPGLREIRVTFSKEMNDRSWSWTEGTTYAVPKTDGEIHFATDQRTCVMPVKLEPGKTYALGINSERFHGFRDQRGQPALPYLVVFRTKSAP